MNKAFITVISLLLLICDNDQEHFFQMPLPFEHSEDVLCCPTIHNTSLIGKYYMEYARVPNEDIIYQESGMYEVADNSIYISVKYDNKIIIKNRKITKSSVGVIPYIEKMVLMLASDDFYSICESNGNLIIETEMSYPDTDWGYSVTMTISKTGEISYSYVDHDEGYMD